MSDNTRFLSTKRKSNETKEEYIERISKNKIINFIHWDKFENVEFLAYGGAAIIKKAEWIEKNVTVVLKAMAVIDNTDSDNDEFIKEIKAFHNIGLVYSSKANEENKEKMTLVGYENYADLGNLRYYLSQNTLNWEQKISIARQITCGLYFLHKNEMLHRDFHTKNVVIQKNGGDIKAIITDFGLSKVLPRNSKSNQSIAGCVAFVDPKLLNNSEDTADYKSDIYSLGVVLWEITSDGRPPFDNCSRFQIAYQIAIGEREKPIEGSTISYVELYTDCWNNNPDSRPEIGLVYKLIHSEDIITGERWKQSPQCNITNTAQITSKSHETKQVLSKILEMLEQLSTKDFETIEQLDPGEITRLVQIAAHRKRMKNDCLFDATED
ncbi:32513_t:CDS:2 [Gigaspora margarita]|uniref:32513_t:CDS:1 n=1 Tax=Gigaspora margarita TaxID=4874 RepID=A0ABN7V6W9_GIGMA|nr:32513_t:CDS:2 [Gigaspora margarita]